MNLISRNKLSEFIKKHKDARAWINNWIAEVEEANWQTPQDVKCRYASASILPNGIIIFNVKGNSYRLEVQISFNNNTVFVKWIGTHAEYDKRYK